MTAKEFIKDKDPHNHHGETIGNETAVILMTEFAKSESIRFGRWLCENADSIGNDEWYNPDFASPIKTAKLYEQFIEEAK